jgi:hypothetical protein
MVWRGVVGGFFCGSPSKLSSCFSSLILPARLVRYPQRRHHPHPRSKGEGMRSILCVCVVVGGGCCIRCLVAREEKLVFGRGWLVPDGCTTRVSVARQRCLPLTDSRSTPFFLFMALGVRAFGWMHLRCWEEAGGGVDSEAA